jgi:hypothetical protein
MGALGAWTSETNGEGRTENSVRPSFKASGVLLFGETWLDPAPCHHNLDGIASSGVSAMPGSPRDLADRMAERRVRQRLDDGFVREQFTQPREIARQTARGFLDRFPKQAYMSEVERWRELPDGSIEFTMRRLRTAD